MQEKPFYDCQNIDLIGYNSNIAYDEEQDEEEEYVFFSFLVGDSVDNILRHCLCFFCFFHW